jgi:hypothetical protein
MIQFNLLPDVKKEYIKAKRTKQLIITISFLVSSIAIGIVVLLFSFVQVIQKNQINDLTDDIQQEIASLSAIQDLNETLTVQNQLNSLPELHATKPQASRLFGYLNQITPTSVKISSTDVNFESNLITISGSAGTLADINQFVDTIKFAKYTSEGVDDGIPFSSVNTQLSRNEEKASYEVSFNFDPILFDNTAEVALVIPTQITTRSITGKPSVDNSLFEDNTDTGGQ